MVRGHGVASGEREGSPFPAGTIALQTPILLARGVDLRCYHPATLNIDMSPWRLELLSPKATIPEVSWTDRHGPETFSFADLRLRVGGRSVAGLLYWPHPETKPMHHQPDSVIEVLAPFIDGVDVGATVEVAPDPDQARFIPVPGSPVSER